MYKLGWRLFKFDLLKFHGTKDEQKKSIYVTARGRGCDQSCCARPYGKRNSSESNAAAYGTYGKCDRGIRWLDGLGTRQDCILVFLPKYLKEKTVSSITQVGWRDTHVYAPIYVYINHTCRTRTGILIISLFFFFFFHRQTHSSILL